MEIATQITRHLKVQQLNVLVAVAETRSIAKAAKQLAISQPAASRAVSDLEKAFGARLFDRSPQGVEPTLYGRALITRASAILNDLKVSAVEIEHLADPTSGEVRIGCPEPFAAGIVGAVVERLTERYPRLSFRIELADGPSLIGRLLPERYVDLAIRSPPERAPDDELHSAILFHNRLCLVAGLQSSWARRRKIELADVIDEPWVGPLYRPPWDELSEACRGAGLPAPKIVVATPACQLTMKLVASGRFIGLCSYGYQYFNAQRLSVKILPLVLPVKLVPVAILTLKNRTPSPAAQLFIDAATEIASPLSKIIPV